MKFFLIFAYDLRVSSLPVYAYFFFIFTFQPHSAKWKLLLTATEIIDFYGYNLRVSWSSGKCFVKFGNRNLHVDIKREKLAWFFVTFHVYSI